MNKYIKYFTAGANVSKYTLISYAMTLIMSSGFSLFSPASLYTTKVYAPLVTGYFEQHKEALIVLAVLWGASSLIRRVMSNIKTVLSNAVLLIGIVAVIVVFWVVFIRPGV